MAFRFPLPEGALSELPEKVLFSRKTTPSSRSIEISFDAATIVRRLQHANTPADLQRELDFFFEHRDSKPHIRAFVNVAFSSPEGSRHYTDHHLATVMATVFTPTELRLAMQERDASRPSGGPALSPAQHAAAQLVLAANALSPVPSSGPETPVATTPT